MSYSHLNSRPIFDNESAQEERIQLPHQFRIVPVDDAAQLPVLRIRGGCDAVPRVRRADEQVERHLWMKMFFFQKLK